MARFKSITAKHPQPRSAPRHDNEASTKDDHSKDLEEPGFPDGNHTDTSDNAQPHTEKSAESVPRETLSLNPPDQPPVTTPRLGLDELESGEEEGVVLTEKQQQVEEGFEERAEAGTEEEIGEETEEETEEEVEDAIEGDSDIQMGNTVSNGTGRPDANTVKSFPPLSPVRDYFDLTYHKRKRQYVMVPKTEEYPRWQGLTSVPVCTLKNQQIHVGAYVDIQMQASSEEAAYAKVKDIRVLEPGHWLLLLAWLYVIDGYWYESNHLQILLWDTVNAVLRPDKIALRSHVIYDACCSGKLLWKQEDLQKWQAREHSLRVVIP